MFFLSSIYEYDKVTKASGHLITFFSVFLCIFFLDKPARVFKNRWY